MKTILIIAALALTSCNTVDYWYNHMFVVPKNPFEKIDVKNKNAEIVCDKFYEIKKHRRHSLQSS